MRYRIALHQSEEGVSVSVPGLPGCWSQGATEAEALDNIEDAIRAYLAVVDDQFVVRGLASRDEARRSGEYFSAQQVLSELDGMLASAESKVRR